MNEFVQFNLLTQINYNIESINLPKNNNQTIMNIVFRQQK